MTPELPALRYAQARRLIQHGERSGELQPIDDAIEHLRAVVASVADVPSACLTDLGTASYLRFDLTGDVESLRSAVQAHRAALRRDELAGQPQQPMRLSNLGMCLTRLFECTDDVDALGEAVAVLRSAAAARTAADPGFAGTCSNLGLTLTRWMERTRDLAPLAEATAAHRTAIAAVRTAPATQAQFLCNLANTMMFAWRETGDRGHLDDAVDAHREAVAIVPTGHPALPGCYAGLSGALVAVSVHTGGREPLLEAIGLLDKGLRQVTATDPDRPIYLNQRANALRINVARAGDVASLEDAIGCWREAVRLLPVDHPDRLAYRSNLALALRNRFEYTSDRASLDEAVDMLRGVVADVPVDHPEWANYQAKLANSLHRVGIHTGEVAPLREAAGLLRIAVAAVPSAHPDHLLYMSNLGGTLLSLAEVGRDDTLLAEATDVLTEVVQLAGPENAELADVQLNLGSAHQTRFQWAGDRAAFGAAAHAYRTLAGTLDAPALMRALAAQKLGHLLARDGDMRGALAGFAAAVQLLDLVAWLGLERDDQEQLLSQFPGLASVAAACAVELGDPDRAVEILEQGRGVLLAQMLSTRVGVDEVRVREPQLAERLTALHRSLESAAGEPAPAARLSRQQMALEREAVLDEIRQSPGLAGFLGPPDIASLRAIVGERIVVAVNVSRYRCDALVVTSVATHVVPLPDLTVTDTIERAAALLEALEDEDQDENPPLLATLAWLWDTVVEPVLDRFDEFGIASTAEPGAQVCWMPTGPLSFLPIHAAGHHGPADGEFRSAMHRVVSSYTSTLRGFGHAAGSAPASAPLVVAVPAAAGHRPLPRAVEEAELVRRHLGGGAVVISAGQATRHDILVHLASTGWAHFACHATTDAAHPSDSHLVLHHGPLRVRDIAAQRNDKHSGRTLVYLSACTTAHGGSRLPDENIHVSSAFQLAGFTTVIGTLWQVPDIVAWRAADLTYAGLANQSPARAVNATTRWLRDRYPTSPSAWAGYIHIGAD